MQTTMIRASMTAYSPAVGPSSRFRKFTTAFLSLRIVVSFSVDDGGKLGSRVRSAGGRGDLVAHVVEGVAGVGAQRADRRDADDDDQGQHDRVLDGRRAVLTLEEVHDAGRETREHGSVLSTKRAFEESCDRAAGSGHDTCPEG